MIILRYQDTCEIIILTRIAQTEQVIGMVCFCVPNNSTSAFPKAVKGCKTKVAWFILGGSSAGKNVVTDRRSLAHRRKLCSDFKGFM